MNSVRLVAGGMLVLLALVPADAYVNLLAGPGSSPSHVAEIMRGAWIGKALLLLHAVLIAFAPRLGIGQTSNAFLVEPRPDAAVSRREWGVLAGLLALGTVLRLYHLGQGLWFDEIQTLLDYARLPVGQIAATFDSQNQHLLYSLTSGISIQLLGESTWAFRLPAAVFGVLSLGALFQLGRQVATTREALLATALITFSYHHVWFSQSARGYTALLFWCLVGTGAFIRLLRGEHRGWWGPIIYGASMALAVYTHVTAVLVVGAHTIVLLATWARSRSSMATAMPALAGLLLSGTLSALLYSLVLPQLFTTLLTPTMHGVDTAWKDPLWLILETLRGLASALPGSWVTLAVALLVAGAGLVSFLRQDATVTGLFVLPALLTGVAAIALGHNLWPRFFFFSAGFAALMAIRGIFTVVGLIRLPRAQLVATAGALLLIAGGAVLLPRAWKPKQDYTGAARFIQQERKPEDAIVVVDLTTIPYLRYLKRPWQAVENAEALEKIEREHGATWVLYTFPIRLAAVHPDIWSRLQAGYDTAAVFPGTVGGGEIVVMVSRPALQTQRSSE